jgi:copper(I)-binding protein
MRSIAKTLACGFLCGWLGLDLTDGAAAYTRLRSEQDTALVKIETDASSAAEIHQMTAINDVMRMRRLDQVELPAGQLVELSPGGRHVMLVKLRHPLKIGDSVKITLTLRLREGSTVRETVNAPVVRKAAHGDHR